MNTILYGQNYKDPLSLVMHDVKEEACSPEEIKEKEATLGNTGLMKNSLKELTNLLESAENYAQKVVVRDSFKNRKGRLKVIGRSVWHCIKV